MPWNPRRAFFYWPSILILPLLSSPLSGPQQEFSTNSKTDKFSQIHEQIDATVDVMVQNLERVLQRGEKIELLVQKTEELQANSLEFRKVSTDLKNHYWWRNVKLWIIAGVCVIVRWTLSIISHLRS